MAPGENEFDTPALVEEGRGGSQMGGSLGLLRNSLLYFAPGE